MLIIEDDPASLDLVSRIAETMGHSVISAIDGTDGIRVALAQHPDIIVLDQHLPDVPGWVVARQLRAEKAFRRTPIIAVSAGGSDERARAIEAGCSDFVAKPYDLAALRAAIDLHSQRLRERAFDPA